MVLRGVAAEEPDADLLAFSLQLTTVRLGHAHDFRIKVVHRLQVKAVDSHVAETDRSGRALVLSS